MISKPYVTYMGFGPGASRYDIRCMKELLGTGRAEMGFMFSREPADGTLQLEELGTLAAQFEGRKVLEVKGSAAQNELLEGKLSSVVSQVNRVIWLGDITEAQVRRLCKGNPTKTIITMLKKGGSTVNHSLAENHHFLLCGSPEETLTAQGWRMPEGDVQFGFAGTIGVENLSQRFGGMKKIARDGWWVDVNTSVKTDGKMDLHKCREFHKALLELSGCLP